MLRLRTYAAPILLLGCAACAREPTVDKTNPAIADQVNEAARNISVTDGREEATMPATPEESGAAMRASASERPRQP